MLQIYDATCKTRNASTQIIPSVAAVWDGVIPSSAQADKCTNGMQVNFGVSITIAKTTRKEMKKCVACRWKCVLDTCHLQAMY
jgi:hypothetical protein